MLDRLLKALGDLGQDLTAEEIADALWLAERDPGGGVDGPGAETGDGPHAGVGVGQREVDDLGQPAGVDEDQRRAVLLDELEQPGVDRRPDAGPGRRAGGASCAGGAPGARWRTPSVAPAPAGEEPSAAAQRSSSLGSPG